jgi:hypothetical protein
MAMDGRYPGNAGAFSGMDGWPVSRKCRSNFQDGWMAGIPEMQEHFPARPWIAGIPEMQEQFPARPWMAGMPEHFPTDCACARALEKPPNKVVIPAKAGIHFALISTTKDQDGFPLSRE